MSLKVLDLFSGIGGTALALKHAKNTKTVGYCEINAMSRKVLEDNMKAGRLDKAPVFENVVDLNKKALADHNIRKIDVITAGFPCQGLSSPGAKRGLYRDPRSSLVRHVLRLTEELRPSYLFCENSPTIVKDKDYLAFLRSLSSLGYTSAFKVVTCAQAGGAQLRARWFLLARRQGAKRFRPEQSKTLRRYYRQQTTKTHDRQRYIHWSRHITFLIGNAVSPAQALLALGSLMDALSATEFEHATKFSDLNFRKSCIFDKGTFFQSSEEQIPDICHGKGYNIVPKNLKINNATTPLISRPFRQQCVPTLRTHTAFIAANRTMTRRSRSDTGTFLLNSKEFLKSFKGNRWSRVISDKFLCALFGFPKDWIRPSLQSI